MDWSLIRQRSLWLSRLCGACLPLPPHLVEREPYGSEPFDPANKDKSAPAEPPDVNLVAGIDKVGEHAVALVELRAVSVKIVVA